MTRDTRRGRYFTGETRANVYHQTTHSALPWLPPKMSEGLQR